MTSVVTTALRELWLHTGTACNLECPFCLEDSKPGDTRLQRLTLPDIKPYLDEAASLGVVRFCFTGGEPLIVKDIVKILNYALQLKPCLVLSNGTAPLIKRAHQLGQLRQHPHALAFRISIDHPDERLHDSQRGWGNFKRALEGLKLLRLAGFEVSIARHAKPDESADGIAARYREMLAKNGLPSDLRIVALPELGRPGVVSSGRTPTTEELTRTPHPLMCLESRMLLKRDDQIRIYACPLTDDDTRFDLGTSLATALTSSIALSHPRCGQCVRCGVNLG